MSKKDYQALARAIHDERQHVPMTAEAALAFERITNAIINVLAEDSTRFDRARFLEACETGSDRESAKRARAASKAALQARRPRR